EPDGGTVDRALGGPQRPEQPEATPGPQQRPPGARRGPEAELPDQDGEEGVAPEKPVRPDTRVAERPAQVRHRAGHEEDGGQRGGQGEAAIQQAGPQGAEQQEDKTGGQGEQQAVDNVESLPGVRGRQPGEREYAE